MFDTVLLRSFVAVVQEGGFTHAAARLNLTQSAVSAHLRRLEKQTGCDLLARTTRSVTLTADGELPALPDVEFTLFAAPDALAPVADELGNAIVLAFAHKS
jgi:hypothetical protein